MPIYDNLYDCAFSCHNAKQYSQAYPLFRRAAERGHAGAQNMVGRYLEEGWAGTRDVAAAIGWYRKAAAQGHAAAKEALDRLEEQKNASEQQMPPQQTAAPTDTPSTPQKDSEKELMQPLDELDALTGLRGAKRTIHRRVASEN